MEDVLQDSDGMETVGKEGPEKTAARALGGQQKDAVPTKCFADSTRKKRERTKINKIINEGFPGVAVVESPPASAGDTGWGTKILQVTWCSQKNNNNKNKVRVQL